MIDAGRHPASVEFDLMHPSGPAKGFLDKHVELGLNPDLTLCFTTTGQVFYRQPAPSARSAKFNDF